MKHSIGRLAAGMVLAFTPLLSLAFVGAAHAAASVTWTGGGSDGNWSTGANWAGGSAPSNGATVVIDNAGSFDNGSVDDIPGLSVASITFINNNDDDAGITLSQNLTVTSAISQAPSANTTTDRITGDSASQTITLGGDVTVTTVGGLTLGNDDDSFTDNLALAGHTLTFTDTGSKDTNSTDIYVAISGNGAVNYNGPSTDYTLYNASTYTGTTDVIAVDSPVALNGQYNGFGSSAITIEPAGGVTLDFDANTTFSNPITVAGSKAGSSINALEFDTGGSGITIAAPHITLNSKARFANNNTTDLKVNLAGITANGFCIAYSGNGKATDAASNGFLNAPTACTASDGLGVPDTGFWIAGAHPLLTLTASLSAAVIILGLAFKMRAMTQR